MHALWETAVALVLVCTGSLLGRMLGTLFESE